MIKTHLKVLFFTWLLKEIGEPGTVGFLDSLLDSLLDCILDSWRDLPSSKACLNINRLQWHGRENSLKEAILE